MTPTTSTYRYAVQICSAEDRGSRSSEEVSWMPVHTKAERKKKGLKRGAKGRIVKAGGSKAKKKKY